MTSSTITAEYEAGLVEALRAQAQDANQWNQDRSLGLVQEHISESARLLQEANEQAADCKAKNKALAECCDYLRAQLTEAQQSYIGCREAMDNAWNDRDKLAERNAHQRATIAGLRLQVADRDKTIASMERNEDLNDGNHDPVVIENARAFLKFHLERFDDWGITPVEFARQVLEDAGHNPSLACGCSDCSTGATVAGLPTIRWVGGALTEEVKRFVCDQFGSKLFGDLPGEAITPDEEARIERCYTREEVRQVALRSWNRARHRIQSFTEATPNPQTDIDRFIADLDD